MIANPIQKMVKKWRDGTIVRRLNRAQSWLAQVQLSRTRGSILQSVSVDRWWYSIEQIAFVGVERRSKPTKQN